MLPTTVQRCTVCGAVAITLFLHRGYSYVRCVQCGHVTTLPYPSSDEIERHYDREFTEGNYRIAREHADVCRASMQQLVGMLDRWLVHDGRSLRGATLLDVGCFTGEFLHEAQQRGASVSGIEAQERAVTIANAMIGPHVVHADATGIVPAFDDRSFDIVSLLGIIEHVTDPERLVTRARELLRPHGTLFIQTPDAGSLPARILRSYWPPYAPIEHVHLFSRRSIAILLQRLGFRIRFERRHVKRLSPAYVFSMLGVFGRELKPFVKPFYALLPECIRHRVLPVFYIGEMVVIAERDASS